jgi:hypothetical protein
VTLAYSTPSANPDRLDLKSPHPTESYQGWSEGSRDPISPVPCLPHSGRTEGSSGGLGESPDDLAQIGVQGLLSFHGVPEQAKAKAKIALLLIQRLFRRKSGDVTGETCFHIETT